MSFENVQDAVDNGDLTMFKRIEAKIDIHSFDDPLNITYALLRGHKKLVEYIILKDYNTEFDVGEVEDALSMGDMDYAESKWLTSFLKTHAYSSSSHAASLEF